MTSNAETMTGEEGRQYHIGLKKGELADKIILIGDPDRIDLGREIFDTKDLENGTASWRERD